MKDFNFQDDLVATKIAQEDVKEENITLSIKNKHLKVEFDANSWDGVAHKIITSSRDK